MKSQQTVPNLTSQVDSMAETALPSYAELRGFFRRRVVCSHEADDLTQETYARVLRWTPPRMIKEPRSALFRIARNLLVDRARRASRDCMETLNDKFELRATTGLTTTDSVEARERLALVRAAIEALPKRCREVFILSRFGGLSYAQIADHFGIAPSTVEKHMIRAIAACRDALKRV